ncbi:MAG TPA: SDR family NAD(P)-dependent oxidoreductase [Candidatus Binatia bacterium]|nr:SDR family NAD(P)-dependent oxidoreductase [Candidatus Binatia bacterium]
MKAAQLFDVSGQVVFVTGAASGLGLAYSEVLAENGAHVVMTDIDERTLRERAATLQQSGASVEAIVLDVGDTDALRGAVDATARKHGRLDVVFANAGISAGTGPFTEAGAIRNVPLERWKNVVDINLTSVFATIQAAAAPMTAQRSGRIIVTSSIGGMKSEPMVGYAYAATKAALNNLIRHAAVELAQHNILVNAIAPGPFLTNIANGRVKKDPEVRKQFEAMIPLHRIAEPDEIKGLALFLASPASSYVTGAVIPIDGGATAW